MSTRRVSYKVSRRVSPTFETEKNYHARRYLKRLPRKDLGNRGDPCFPLVDEPAGLRLLMQVLPKIIVFSEKDVKFLNRERD